MLCVRDVSLSEREFLHVGHMRNFTIGDLIARYKRMKGFNVMYPMGFDAFGLPAENAAIKQGIRPKKYTENAIKTIKKYMRELALSYDWSRELRRVRRNITGGINGYFCACLRRELLIARRRLLTGALRARQYWLTKKLLLESAGDATAM